MDNTDYYGQFNEQVQRIPSEFVKYQWKYKNLILLSLSIIAAYLILSSPRAYEIISNVGNFGYVGSFISGFLFTYALTTVPATAIILILGENLNVFLIAFIGAFGSVISDYLIFRFVRDRLLDEIKLLSKEINNLTEPVSGMFISRDIRIRLWRKISKSRVWRFLVPVFAGFIIASPLPDELGAAMFAAIKFNPKRFLILGYTLNFLGILTIASIGKFF